METSAGSVNTKHTYKKACEIKEKILKCSQSSDLTSAVNEWRILWNDKSSALCVCYNLQTMRLLELGISGCKKIGIHHIEQKYKNSLLIEYLRTDIGKEAIHCEYLDLNMEIGFHKFLCEKTCEIRAHLKQTEDDITMFYDVFHPMDLFIQHIRDLMENFDFYSGNKYIDEFLVECSQKEAFIPEIKQEEQEIPEIKQEEQEIPEIKQEEIPEIKQEEVPEIKQEEIPEIKEEEVPEIKQEEIPEIKEEEVPEIKQEEFPEIKQEEVPEIKQEEFPEIKEEEVPEIKQEEFPEIKEEEVPEIKQEEFTEIKEEEVPEIKQEEFPEIKEEEVPEIKEEPIKPKKERKHNRKLRYRENIISVKEESLNSVGEQIEEIIVNVLKEDVSITHVGEQIEEIITYPTEEISTNIIDEISTDVLNEDVSKSPVGEQIEEIVNVLKDEICTNTTDEISTNITEEISTNITEQIITYPTDEISTNVLKEDVSITHVGEQIEEIVILSIDENELNKKIITYEEMRKMDISNLRTRVRQSMHYISEDRQKRIALHRQNTDFLYEGIEKLKEGIEEYRRDFLRFKTRLEEQTKRVDEMMEKYVYKTRK